jgi:hypothetical protein
MNYGNVTRQKEAFNQVWFQILELNVQDPITFRSGKKTENNENTDKIMLVVPSSKLM